MLLRLSLLRRRGPLLWPPPPAAVGTCSCGGAVRSTQCTYRGRRHITQTAAREWFFGAAESQEPELSPYERAMLTRERERREWDRPAYVPQQKVQNAHRSPQAEAAIRERLKAQAAEKASAAFAREMREMRRAGAVAEKAATTTTTTTKKKRDLATALPHEMSPAEWKAESARRRAGGSAGSTTHMTPLERRAALSERREAQQQQQQNGNETTETKEHNSPPPSGTSTNAGGNGGGNSDGGGGGGGGGVLLTQRQYELKQEQSYNTHLALRCCAPIAGGSIASVLPAFGSAPPGAKEFYGAVIGYFAVSALFRKRGLLAYGSGSESEPWLIPSSSAICVPPYGWKWDRMDYAEYQYRHLNGYYNKDKGKGHDGGSSSWWERGRMLWFGLLARWTMGKIAAASIKGIALRLAATKMLPAKLLSAALLFVAGMRTRARARTHTVHTACSFCISASLLPPDITYVPLYDRSGE
jgi:hypothetical protein